MDQAIALAGVDSSWKPALEWIVQQESGGNPKAVNPTPVGKEHATGLMQTLPSTFKEYTIPGTDIYNPIYNAVAAIRYIKSRYGSPYKIPGLYKTPWRGY